MAKFLGFEIKKADTHSTKSGPSPVQNTSLQAQLQETKESLPLKSSHPRDVLGDSGIRMLHGIIAEEYNPQLQGIEGIKIFDEMRKGDGTVRAAVLACTLPIRRAKWFVNSATDEQKDKDIAQFVEHALFDWMDITWDDFIRQALNMVPLGVMLFEKVYGTRNHDGKDYVTIEKMAPRMPKSILMWELVDQTFGIQQIRQDGVLAQIPGSKLLIFVNEREGNNWWGTSALRAAYHHWYNKQLFYKIDAIAFERQGLGVPKITMPVGYTEADEKKAMTVLQNLRANENSFLLLPPEYEAEFMNMGAHTTRDPEKSIGHHNKEILQSVLAQFLELGVQGSAGTGSRAVSTDHSDLFLKGIESIANTIRDEINRKLVKELVDLNFNDVKVYPVIDYSGITKVDAAALATAYGSLVKAGAINPTDDDQQYIRAAMGLPPRSREDIENEADGEPTENELEDGADIEEVDEDSEVESEDDRDETETTDKKDKKKVDDSTDSAKKEQDKKQPTKQKDTKGKKKASEKIFAPYRPLTFAEQKVDWQKIQDKMDALENGFDEDAKQQLKDAKDTFIAKLHSALELKNQDLIGSLEIQFETEYAGLVYALANKAYTYGKNTAAQEMGIANPPANSAESIANLKQVANAIAEKTMTDLETKAKLSAINAIKTDTKPLQAIAQIDQDLDDMIDKTIDNVSGTLVAQNVNNGRNDVFQANKDMIYALQRSELLDKKTCNFCISMDGRIVACDDPFAGNDAFHSNCRGLWVEILNGESEKPDIDGVPENVAAHYGGQTNELIQPKQPITKAGSLADNFVKSQKAKEK